MNLLGGKKESVLTVNLSRSVTTTDDREGGFAEAAKSAGFESVLARSTVDNLSDPSFGTCVYSFTFPKK